MQPETEAPAPSASDGAGAVSHEATSRGDTARALHQTELPRIGPVSSPDDLPEIAAYLARIGATVLNMHTATIKAMVEGYPKEIGRVIFDLADGTVKVTGAAEAPTPEEADAIAVAIKRATFPSRVNIVAIADPPPGVNLNDRHTYVCHDFNGEIVAVRRRYQKEDGGKGFETWTKWSDGQWRNMEPEIMPFYGLHPVQDGRKLRSYRDCPTLVLHEGEKAAARLRRLQEGLEAADRFPWWSEYIIRNACHVGWIGGTHAIDRSDWERLAACNWRRVIVIADNGNQGMKAARRVAERFPAHVEIVAFDQRFSEGFDLGDDWPEDQFDEKGRYIGPALRDCLLPATVATLLIPPEGRGPPTIVLRDEYAERLAYTADPPRIIYRDNPSRDMRPDTFNIKVAPFSHAKDTAAKVWGHLGCQHERMVYRPGFQPGTLNIDGQRCFNVYEDAQIEPLAGDQSPWLEFLEHLFPVPEERELVMRWLATLIALPRTRMRYGLLLISTMHGVGKNTLGNILRVLLGAQNVSFPSESSVVNSDFNGWLSRKRLIFIGEFYSGHSRKAYDKLKPMLTDDLVQVNEKGVNQYEMENWATVIACSNSERALHLDDEDRRWMVPTVTEETKPTEYWLALYSWLAAEGPGVILRWALDYVASGNQVRTGDHAPGTGRKAVIVEESRSDGKKLAHWLGEHLTGLSDKVFVRLDEIRTWIAAQRGLTQADARLEGKSTITAVLKKVPGLIVWTDKQRPNFGAVRDAVVMNFDPGPGVGWAEVKERHKRLTAADLENFDEM